MQLKKIFVLIFIFFLLTPSVLSARATSNFLLNPEKSNYVPGHGNITYPVITHRSTEGSFSENIAVGDINGDGKEEIVGIPTLPTQIQPIDTTLYVYSSNLSLLWKYKVTDPMLEKNSEWEFSALALGDLDGDGSDEIIFSISPSVGPIGYSSAIWSKTVLHVLKGDGTELWNRTFEGGITSESLVVGDINGDGRDEIIVGCKNLYILDSNGEILSSYSLDNYTYRGISEIAVHGKEIVLTFWYYNNIWYDKNGEGIITSDNFRVYESLYSIEKFEYENSSFHKIWSLQLENDRSVIFSSMYYRFFPAGDFSMAYIVRTDPDGIVAINLTDGKKEWSHKQLLSYASQIGISVLPDKVIWNTGYRIYVLNKSGGCISSHDFTENGHPPLRAAIAVFDVDNDGVEEAVALYKNRIVFYSLPDLKEELDVRIWEKIASLFPPPVILHSDVDNDGFDEIITVAPSRTTNPTGQIVIIDNGTPPAPPPPEENKFPVNELIIAGTGIIGAVALITVVLWKKQKRRKSQ